MATSAAAAIAAATARARREVREHFEDAAAFSHERAIRYDPPCHLHERQFELLIGQGILKETESGRFWIDRVAVELEAEQRRHALKILLVIILAGLAIAVGISLALIRHH